MIIASSLLVPPHNTTMSGCTLRLSRDYPLRTSLVDEATGHVKYQIDTPMKFARSVTRIRKFDSPTQPPLHGRDDDPGSDSGDGNTDKKVYKSKEEEDDETGAELPESSDEIARIYWKWFSSDRIVFRGRITSQAELLPKTGKIKGSAVLR